MWHSLSLFLIRYHENKKNNRPFLTDLLLCYAGARTEPACEPGQDDSIVDVPNQILKFRSVEGWEKLDFALKLSLMTYTRSQIKEKKLNLNRIEPWTVYIIHWM